MLFTVAVYLMLSMLSVLLTSALFYRRKAEPSASELIGVEPATPVWIRCNAWEFRPAKMADVRPGDSFIYAAAKEDQEFWSALADLDLEEDDDA